jgi:hypothetical protein
MEVLRMLSELASTNFGNISLVAYNSLRKKIQKCPAPRYSLAFLKKRCQKITFKLDETLDLNKASLNTKVLLLLSAAVWFL